MNKCPTCKIGNIIELDGVGETCDKCGLILSSYNDRSAITVLNKSKKNRIRRQQRHGARQDIEKFKCVICKARNDLTIHHIIPLRENKSDKRVVVLCRHCHNIADMIVNIIYPEDVKLKSKK